MPVRIVLADDHAIVREALKLLLTEAGFEVVGEASDGLEALRLACQLEPDVAILDVVMPLLNGLDAGRQIQHSCPKTKIILLTSRQDEELFLEAMKAGMRACVLKTYHAAELIKAVREVVAGSVYLSQTMSKSLVEAYRAHSVLPADPLSDRERQVLQLIAEGKRTREVAELLGVSVKTAESHRSHIMKKLDINETAGLVRYAIQRGIIRI